MQGNLPASDLVGQVLSLWVELEPLEPREAELEGEGLQSGKKVGVGGLRGPVPLEAVASPSPGGDGTAGHVRELSLSPAPEPPPGLQRSRAPGRACSRVRAGFCCA